MVISLRKITERSDRIARDLLKKNTLRDTRGLLRYRSRMTVEVKKNRSSAHQDQKATYIKSKDRAKAETPENKNIQGEPEETPVRYLDGFLPKPPLLRKTGPSL